MDKKTGREPFRDGAEQLDFNLSSFWQWALSDLASNVTRSTLAEYIVGHALGATDEAREQFAHYDLRMRCGTRVEV